MEPFEFVGKIINEEGPGCLIIEPENEPGQHWRAKYFRDPSGRRRWVVLTRLTPVTD